MEFPLEKLIGPAQVIQIDDQVDLITADVLARVKFLAGVKKVLFKTRNRKIWERKDKKFIKNFVGISADAAEDLVKRGMELVGLDYLSVGPFGNGVETHHVLLGAGMALLEGADLSSIKPGRYMLYCLPIKLGATEGAPARAILIKE